MTEGWKSRRFKQGACLQCGTQLTGISGPKGHTPEKGSIMICVECSYVMEWSGEGFVELSAEAMKEIENEPELQEALKASRAFRDFLDSPPVIRTDDPQRVIDAIKGINPDVRVVVLEDLPPEICEECGKLKELRPYGLKKPNGLRKWVCVPCAEKNPEELSRAWDERMEGKNPV